MNNSQTSLKQPPHVLVFPLPAQGHVNSMLKLSELLALSGLKLTFLNTEHIHHRLVQFTDIEIRFSKYPEFQFKTITDGMPLPVEQPRTADILFDQFAAMKSVTKSALKEMVMKSEPPITLIIGDGILGFILDVGAEVGIPVFQFRTIGACCFWTYFCLPHVIEANELPIKGDDDMDRIITKVPGMEAFLRCRDLPSFCRVNNIDDPNVLHVINETKRNSQAHALILNTFEDLEAQILSHVRNHCTKIYTIGPVHQLLKAKLKTHGLVQQLHETNFNHSCNNIFAVDRTCMSWLDNQPSRTVLYLSFGSYTVMTREQLMEFWFGLVNSSASFLWVIRPDLIINKENEENIPGDLLEKTREKGFIVDWVPQEEVLGHEAIGGFLTHSGWNSTLESIVEGVGMICWPYFADQQVNSRFVSEVWKVGLDMKDVCDRKVVEKFVNDLMVERREEFKKSTIRMSQLAKKSVSQDGSSSLNFDILVQDIKLMSK